VTNPDTNPDILRIQAEVEKLTNDAEAAANAENIDEAQLLMDKVYYLQKERENILVGGTSLIFCDAYS
jgi:hypothetical protein